MFAPERRQLILAALTRNGRVEVAALAASLQVSEDTVRRDLKTLTEQGIVQKTHGGAVLLATAHIPFPARNTIRPMVKAGIGARAARLIEARQTVFIDAGSTTLQLARTLDVAELTVITNSLDVATALAERPGITLVMSGGLWCAPERYFSGEGALATVEAHRADLAFIGACAVHPRLGVTANGAHDAQVKAAMIRNAASAVLLADESKFGQIAAHAVAGVRDFARVITDRSPSWLAEAGPAIDIVAAD